MTFSLTPTEEPELEREVASILTESDSVSDALVLVLRRVCETVGWDLGQAWLPSFDERTLQLSPACHGDSVAFEPLRAALAKCRIKRGGSLAGCAWSTHEAQWMSATINGRSSTRLGWNKDALSNRNGLRTGLAIPILVGRSVPVVLEFWTRENRAQNARMTLFIASLASHLQKVIVHQLEAEARRRSEEWFRAAMEGSPAAFWILQSERHQEDAIGDFRFLYTNARGEELLRLPRQKIVGQRLSQVLASEIVPDFIERLIQVAESQQGHEDEWRIARLSKKQAPSKSDGLWIRSQIVPLQNGVSITLQDVSKQKHFEHSLRESEDRFRSLIENASDVITILESDGQIRYESASIERVLGFKPEELIGTNAFQWVHPEDVHRILKMADTVRQQPGTSFPVIFRMRHKDNSWRWLEVLANNLIHRPEVGGLILNSRDISERVAYEERIKIQQAQLEKANRELATANRKLETLATTDGLTHLHNHRTFQQR